MTVKMTHEKEHKKTFKTANTVGEQYSIQQAYPKTKDLSLQSV